MSRRPTRTHRVEYLGLLGAGGLLRILPERAATRASEAMGGVFGGLLRFRRPVVDANLRLAFPELTDRERDRIAVDCYRHLVREGGLLLGSTVRPMTPEKVLARARLGDDRSAQTLEWMRSRAKQAQATLIMSGHLGNWEMAGSFLSASGVPLHAVAVPQRNPLFDARIRSTRRRLGITLISRDDAVAEVPRALEAGRTVGLVADQHSQKGVTVDFFRHPVRAARGPAIFALRAGVPAVLGFLVRNPGWPPRYSAYLERLDFEPSGRTADDIVRWTTGYLSGLERYIRRFPDQYLWHHKRWRDRPEEPSASGDELAPDS